MGEEVKRTGQVKELAALFNSQQSGLTSSPSIILKKIQKKSDPKQTSSKLLELTEEERNALLPHIEKLPPTYKEKIKLWATGQTKMDKPAVLKMLEGSMDDYSAQPVDQFPNENYNNFIAALPQSIRGEAYLIMEKLTQEPSDETTEQNDAKLERKNSNSQFIELSVEECKAIAPHISNLTYGFQSKIQLWVSKEITMTKSEILTYLARSMDDFLKRSGEKYPPTNYENFIAALPLSIREDASTLFQQKLQNLQGYTDSDPLPGPPDPLLTISPVDSVKTNLSNGVSPPPPQSQERKNSNSQYIELTKAECKAIAFHIPNLTKGFQNRIRQWVKGQIKMTKPQILDYLGRSMDSFLQKNTDEYPPENYKNFIAALPLSIREDASTLFQQKLQALHQGYTTDSDPLPEPQDNEKPESKHASDNLFTLTETEWQDVCSDILRKADAVSALPSQSQTKLISWASGQESSLEKALEDSMDVFLEQPRERYPIANYEKFINNVLPTSIRTEATSLFWLKIDLMNLPRLLAPPTGGQNKENLLEAISLLPPLQSQASIKAWANGQKMKESEVIQMLTESMDAFLDQNREEYPIQHYQTLIKTLPMSIRGDMDTQFKEKARAKGVTLPAEIRHDEDDSDPSCIDETLAFLWNHAFAITLASYSVGLGIALGAAYLVNSKATKDFVTAIPSCDSVEKFFNNALAVYLTPVVLVSLIAVIVAGYRYKKLEDQYIRVPETNSIK